MYSNMRLSKIELELLKAMCEAGSVKFVLTCTEEKSDDDYSVWNYRIEGDNENILVKNASMADMNGLVDKGLVLNEGRSSFSVTEAGRRRVATFIRHE